MIQWSKVKYECTSDISKYTNSNCTRLGEVPGCYAHHNGLIRSCGKICNAVYTSAMERNCNMWCPDYWTLGDCKRVIEASSTSVATTARSMSSHVARNMTRSVTSSTTPGSLTNGRTTAGRVSTGLTVDPVSLVIGLSVTVGVLLLLLLIVCYREKLWIIYQKLCVSWRGRRRRRRVSSQSGDDETSGDDESVEVSTLTGSGSALIDTVAVPISERTNEWCGDTNGLFERPPTPEPTLLERPVLGRPVSADFSESRRETYV